MTQIFVGSDHRGFAMKGALIDHLKTKGYEVVDVGDKEFDPEDDFPKYARSAVLKLLAAGSDAKAILLCGGGQGMCMAANRFKGVRAVVVWDSTEAKIARNDNDSNVLCLPARILENDQPLWQDIVDTWLEAPFANAARFVRRNNELDKLT